MHNIFTQCYWVSYHLTISVKLTEGMCYFGLHVIIYENTRTFVHGFSVNTFSSMLIKTDLCDNINGGQEIWSSLYQLETGVFNLRSWVSNLGGNPISCNMSLQSGSNWLNQFTQFAMRHLRLLGLEQQRAMYRSIGSIVSAKFKVWKLIDSRNPGWSFPQRIIFSISPVLVAVATSSDHQLLAELLLLHVYQKHPPLSQHF